MWDELFSGRKWRVAEEVSGTVQQDGVTVTFDRGRFELPVQLPDNPDGAAFRSLLSTNLGRRGVLLQETDETGSSDVPGSRITVGTGSLQKAREQYAAVW
jgi:hypothetical protein